MQNNNDKKPCTPEYLFCLIFDSELALKEQVNELCQLASQVIRQIGSVRQYLSVEATRTLVSSRVL